MTKSPVDLIAMAAALALLPAGLLAQAQPALPPTGDEPSLPLVRAKASADKDSAAAPSLGYGARRGSTATKTDTPLNEVPQAIAVITADQIKDQNAQNMQEVLRYAAGVRAEMYGLDNRGDWFSLRGGSEGSTLLDGLRLPLTGWYGVVRNEPYAFERIEVLRGPASVIAGQNGPGGVVNMVSKRPHADALREVAVQIGNNGHRQIAADLGGALNTDGSLRYRLVALRKDSGTQVEHADDLRSFVAPSLTWRPTPQTSLTVYAEYQKDRSGNTNAFLGYAGTLLPAPHGPISPSLFIGEPAWDRYGGERQRWGYEFEQALSADWTLRHHLRQDRVDGAMRTMYAAWWDGFTDATGAPDANGTHLNRIWYATDNKARITNADLLLEGKLNWGRARHNLMLGIDHMKNSDDQASWDDGPGTPLDVYHPVYGSFADPTIGIAPPNLARTRVRNTGLLLQDQIKFDQRYVVVAGLRRDRAQSEGAPTESATSKNLGFVYLADGGWSPYASYSESFEPIGGARLDGTPFKPKRGKQLEAGLKWSPDHGRITAAAALYQLKEKNRLMTDPSNPNDRVQRGEVTVKGLELETTARLPAWDLIASYTYTDARQTSVGADALSYLDKQLPSIPKHSASVWAVHPLGAYGLPGFKLGGGVRYVGRTWDGLDSVAVPAYTLVDALLSYERDAWRVSLNISNLANKTYLATCLERGDCWFGTQRKAVATLAYRW